MDGRVATRRIKSSGGVFLFLDKRKFVTSTIEVFYGTFHIE